MADQLAELAAARGVATEYEDQRRRRVEVAESAVRRVLDVLGDTPTPRPLSASADAAVALPPGPRAWGWMVQLYAIPSRDSWGIGDLHDLRTLVEWTASRGGGLVLVNPLHAVALTAPMQPSPYFPASRRWTNPVYLRVEDTAEYAAAPPSLQARVDALRVSFTGDRIDRDRSWAAKSAALELLAPEEFPVSDEVRGFAVWSALAEVHGPDWREWPPSLHRPDDPAVAAAADDLCARVRFHAWLQARCDEQLAAVQQAARGAGMPVGVVHDLAVGTDPGGADAWELQDLLALGAHIGAPPDTFNQQGQDWGMPPWHPGALAAADYLPLRRLVRSTVRHGGGIRIDHVLGMFRAWWVPVGDSAAGGTYVSYDADAMLAAVTREAAASDAVVVGEDLGTVPPYVRDALARRGMLGTSVLWFEREDAVDGKAGAIRPLASWREAAMASVTTHDLPTALGWWRGEHVRVRVELGLVEDPAAERESWLAERRELLDLLRAARLVTTDAPGDADVVEALHLAVATTPSRYVMASLGDAVGDLRQPNLPATTDEYPNWRLPVADAAGRVMLIEDLLDDERVGRLADHLSRVLASTIG